MPVPSRVVDRLFSDPPAWVVSLSGEHDLSTAPELARSLAFAVASGDPVIVDLGPASFADSAILGVLIRATKRAGPGRLAVVTPPAGAVSTLFEVVDAGSLLATFPTVHDAVEWCHRQGRPEPGSPGIGVD